VQHDHYRILGVTRSASAEEIKAAYRKLARRFHPDVSREPRSEEQFKEVTLAYHVLRDTERRGRYDIESMERDLDASERNLAAAAETLANGYAAAAASIPRAAPGPEARWEGAFGEFEEAPPEKQAGLMRRFSRRRPERAETDGYPVPGDDYEVVAEVTFEEAVRGGVITLTYAVPERTGNGGKREIEQTIEVRVPKNVPEGQRVRLKGKGGLGTNGAPNGDLHVEIAYKRHRLFRIRDNDVWFYLPIAPWEAVLGAVLEIPTLDGKPFRVHVPAGATSGQTFRLPGRGLPKLGGRRGDLLACLRIITPEHPTETEKQLYLQLARQSRFNARRGFG
jgi:curved DNA-binding protein